MPPAPEQQEMLNALVNAHDKLLPTEAPILFTIKEQVDGVAESRIRL